MRILVTGGTGFTGAALVTRLLADGHQVVALDKHPGLIDAELRRKGAEIVYGSIVDRDVVAKCSRGVDVVQHLAAAFREIRVTDEVYKSVNVDGTRVVTEEAIKAGARKLVYCSTQGVHGHIHKPPGDESSPIAPADYYQQTKYEGELVVREVAGKAGLEYTIIRPTAIYGPGDPGRFLMIYKRAASGRFPMFGGGLTFYHPVYIDNLVDAFVLGMGPGVGAAREYLVGDAEYFSLQELVTRVGKALGVSVRIPHFPLWPLVVAGHVCETLCKPFDVEPPIFSRRVDWFRQVRAFRIDKARRELGYAPAIGIDEGLRRTGEWYREHGYL